MAIERIPAPTAGVDTRSAPDSMVKNAALELENFVTGRPGKITARPGTGFPVKAYDGGTGVTANLPTGIFVHGKKVLITGGVTDSRFGEPNTGADFTTVTLSNVNRRLDGRSVRAGAYAFGPAKTAASPLLRWAGTSTEPAQVTNAPYGATDVAFHLQRLIVAGGSVPGTTTPGKPNALYWTDQLDAQTCDVLTDWKDDVSGLVNQLLVGSDGDAIVGIASLSRQLVIFKQNSIWLLKGDSPSTWSLVQLSDNLGGMSKMSKIVADDSVLFVDTEGSWRLYDGAQLVSLRGTGPLFQFAAGPMAVGNFANGHNIIRLSTEYFLVNDTRSTQVGQTYTRFWALHLPTRSWSIWTYDGSVVYDPDRPKRMFHTEDGKAWLFDDWMVSQRLVVEADGSWADVSRTGQLVPVPMKWRTHVASLSLPQRASVLQRMFLDHRLLSVNLAVNWDIVLNDATDATTPKLTTTVAGRDSNVQPPGWLRDRASIECFEEISDAVITITCTPDSLSAIMVAELQDLWLEFEPAQR